MLSLSSFLLISLYQKIIVKVLIADVICMSPKLFQVHRNKILIPMCTLELIINLFAYCRQLLAATIHSAHSGQSKGTLICSISVSALSGCSETKCLLLSDGLFMNYVMTDHGCLLYLKFPPVGSLWLDLFLIINLIGNSISQCGIEKDKSICILKIFKRWCQ